MEKQLLEDLKNDIRIWKKNEQAFCDLAGLIYELKTKSERNIDISIATLFYRVMNNLEDPEIWIGYKGESLYELYDKVLDEIYNIEKRYSQILPESSGTYLKEIRSKNIGEYLFNSVIVDDNRNRISWYDEPYNVVTLLKDETNWIRELLISKIPKKIRIQMLDDIIKFNKVSLDSLVADSYYPDSVCPTVYRTKDDEEEAKKKSIEEVMELFSDWEKVTLRSKDDTRAMMNHMSIDNLAFLQRNNIIDFVKEATYSSEYGTVGVPAQIFKRSPQNLSALIEFYGFESYQKLDEKIKQNTDKFLIYGLLDYNFFSLLDFIESKDLKISDENIAELILALSSRQKDYHKNLKLMEINQICETIERKAQTPKEYRKFKRYTAQIRDCLDPEKLQQQRWEFVLRLRNMNESLQGQVPGKMKIKDIKFQVENK